jgi:hypothetical protein
MQGDVHKSYSVGKKVRDGVTVRQFSSLIYELC